MNNFIKTCVSMAAAMTLAGAVPAAAQRHGDGSHGGSHGGGSHGAGVSHGSAAPRSIGGGGGGRSFSTAPRTFSASRSIGPARSFAAPRVVGPSRSFAVPARSFGYRSYAAPRVIGGARSFGYATRTVGPRVIVGAPFRGFARPYYAFRPRFSIGFGISVGYPIAFPYYAYDYGYPYPYYSYPYASAYGYPYPYPVPSDPYAYGYPSAGYSSGYPNAGYPGAPPAAIGPAPAAPEDLRDVGGLSFDVTPSNAEVLIDGHVVGTVGNFSPSSQPLTLTPGRHHLEIRAPGYRSVTDDVDITAGEVIPYNGTLER
jgi:hypothetical protein